MTVSDLCLMPGVVIAFATLVVKIVDVRNGKHTGGARADTRAPND